MTSTRGEPPSLRTLAERFVLLGFVMAVLYLGSSVFLPIVSAGLLTLLVLPFVQFLERLGLPQFIASAAVLLGFVGTLVVVGFQLQGPASKWVDRAPSDLVELQQEIRSLRAPLESMAEAADEVEVMAQGDRSSRDQTVEVEPNSEESLSDRVVKVTWQSTTFFVLVTVLVFFMLLGRNRILAKAVMLSPDPDAWDRVVTTASDIRGRLSTFVATMTVINLGLGTAVGTVLWLLEYPNPVLWGTMVAILNFVPYLGSATGIIIVGVVGLLMFDGNARPLLAVSGYLVLTTIEGTLVSPGLLSDRLRLDPVATLVGLLVFGFVWGIPGVILSVPLLVCIKVISENYGRAATLAALIGRGHESVPRRVGSESGDGGRSRSEAEASTTSTGE